MTRRSFALRLTAWLAAWPVLSFLNREKPAVVTSTWTSTTFDGVTVTRSISDAYRTIPSPHGYRISVQTFTT